MTPLIIIGAGIMAKLAAWYFEMDPLYSLQGFCVEDKFYASSHAHGLPVFPDSKMDSHWPPGSCRIFVGIGYQNQNGERERLYQKYRKRGYAMASCVSGNALILNDANYGENCFIMEGAVLQPFSRLGNNCICWSNSVAAHESMIGDNCFLAAGAVVGGMARVGANTFMGINSCVRNGVSIGSRCIIGAGCVALQDMEDDSLLMPKAASPASIRASQAMRFLDF